MRYSAKRIAKILSIHCPTNEQIAVIEAPSDAPVLVVAGAGSGKTETMAARVVWLVANRYVEPDQVLGLTFTRKAAGQLAERIGQRLRRLRREGLWVPTSDENGTPTLGNLPTVQTYHSYAGRLVGEHGLRFGIEPKSRLLLETDTWQLAAEVVLTYDGPMDLVDADAADVTSGVIRLANEMAEHLVSPAQFADYLDQFLRLTGDLPSVNRTTVNISDIAEVRGAIAARWQVLPIVERFMQLKKERSALDFADQMAHAARLAQTFPALGALERRRFRAVLLDEFQDASEAQMVLLRSLFVASGEAVRVTAVGDPNQSIYGWRGASAITMATFPELLADASGPAKILQLSTSWRNDNVILATANRVSAPLRASSKMLIEILRARPGAGPGVAKVARLEDQEAEATYVANWIALRYTDADGEWTGRTAAVLCRKRLISVAIVDALRQHGIPVEVVGMGGLLTTPEVADVVSLLWAVQDPTRGDQLMRLLTRPALRLGAADLDGLGAWARQPLQRDQSQINCERTDIEAETHDRLSIIEALDELPNAEWRGTAGERISSTALGRLAGLGRAIRRLRSLTGLPLPELLGEAERVLGLDVEMLAIPGQAPGTARVHLDGLADVAVGFTASADWPTLGGFLDWLTIAEREERGLKRPYLENEAHAVQVLTVHAAKGLEWDIVAVPGMVEGTFPAYTCHVTWHEELQGWKIGKKGLPGDPSSWCTRDSAWTKGIAGLPFDLRGDADGLPQLRWAEVVDARELRDAIVEFRSTVGDHVFDEERRLAYVSFTRARSELLLTSAVWTTGSSLRLTSRYVTELIDAGLVVLDEWAPMPASGESKVADQRVGSEKASRWPSDPLAHQRAQFADGALRVCEMITTTGSSQKVLPLDDRAQEIELLLRERDRARRQDQQVVQVPCRLSASAVVALADDPEVFARQLRRPMPMPPALAARRGTAFHAWIEQHYARAALTDVVELPDSEDEDSDVDLTSMKKLFLQSEWASRIPEEIEVAVETWVNRLSVFGRIDAVFPRVGGGFVIVDWKTENRFSGKRRVTARVLQLAAYRLAYARLRKIPTDEVDAAFYYAGTGETIWPKLPPDDTIDGLLAKILD